MVEGWKRNVNGKRKEVNGGAPRYFLPQEEFDHLVRRELALFFLHRSRRENQR